MGENVLSSGSYSPRSGETRFHRMQDITGRRASKMLGEPEGSGYLAEKRREHLARHQITAKNLLEIMGSLLQFVVMG